MQGLMVVIDLELIFEANVKEHATLSAGPHVDHGVEVKTTEEHENRAADRGCVSRIVLLLVVPSNYFAGVVTSIDF